MIDHRDRPLDGELQAHRRGEPGASARAAALLREPVTRALEEGLGADHVIVHQAVDEVIPAALDYLRRDPDPGRDPERLVATMALNRARDLLRWRHRPPPVDPDSLADWLADPRRSILDEIEPERRTALLRSALGRLTADCRDLLRTLHVEHLGHESARLRLGLATVSNLLYRRAVCLRRVKAYLAPRLHGDHPDLDGLRDDDSVETAGYTCLDPALGGDLWRLDDPATDPTRRRRLANHLAYCASCRQQRAVESSVEEGLGAGELRLGSEAARSLRLIRALGLGGGIALIMGLILAVLLPAGAHTAGRIVGLAGLASLTVATVLRQRRRSLASALEDVV